MTDDLRELSQRKLSFLQTVKAVLWGFFGVRRGASYQEDIARLNPVHLIIAGILGAVLFVTLLVVLVRIAVSSLT